MFIWYQKLFLSSSYLDGAPVDDCFLISSSSFFTSSGSLNYIIMQVILSVPVPSDIVISPFAMPWSIISSTMKDVSPGGFCFFKGSDFIFCVFSGEPAWPGFVFFPSGFFVDGPF